MALHRPDPDRPVARRAYRLEKEGKRAVFIGIENGYPIGNDLALMNRTTTWVYATSPCATVKTTISVILPPIRPGRSTMA